jgi:hypothetical protein
MKMKVLGLVVCTLLIASAVLPAAGIMISDKSKNDDKRYIKKIAETSKTESLTTELIQPTLGEDGDWDYWSNPPNMYAIINGKVGIGTTNPTSKLHLNGSDTIPILSVEQKGPGRGVRINSSNCDALWIEHAGNHGVRISYAQYDGIHVMEAGNLAANFNGKGYFSDNLGIGTMSPQYLLDIYGEEDIVARFSGRVIGTNAVNDNEFVTKGQVKSLTRVSYTPSGSDDDKGNIGDISWDDSYFYVKTKDGWKRAALETW